MTTYLHTSNELFLIKLASTKVYSTFVQIIRCLSLAIVITQISASLAKLNCFSRLLLRQRKEMLERRLNVSQQGER